jgi:DNA-binding LacI/PurR family transcriptional regulator
MLADENVIIRIKGKGSYVSPYFQQSLSSGKGRLIGVLFPSFLDSYGKQVYQTIERCCKDNKMLCVFHLTQESQQLEKQCLDEMIRHGVSGIIIMPVHGAYYNATVLNLILDGFPIVVIDRELRGIPTNFVGTDNIEAAKAAVSFLISAGHKKIGIYSSYPLRTSSLEDRINGARHSIDKAPGVQGYVFTEVYKNFYRDGSAASYEKDMLAVVDHIQNNRGITAVFATNMQIAVIVKKAILSMGLRVPEDISVICFDSSEADYSEYESESYEFTHIRQDELQIGKAAFDLLQTLVFGQNQKEAVKVTVPFSIVKGLSTL